jgi:hypothetical protein
MTRWGCSLIGSRPRLSTPMSQHEHEVLSPRLLHIGFQRARDRYMAEGRLATDPAEALLPIIEALNWATTLDERLAADKGTPPSLDWTWRDKHEQGRVMRGVRFVRNRVHHQWATALYLDLRGAELPMPLPAPLFEWRWRSRLPPGHDNHGEDDYRDHLAEHPARRTLDALSELFLEAVP